MSYVRRAVICRLRSETCEQAGPAVWDLVEHLRDYAAGIWFLVGADSLGPRPQALFLSRFAAADTHRRAAQTIFASFCLQLETLARAKPAEFIGQLRRRRRVYAATAHGVCLLLKRSRPAFCR